MPNWCANSVKFTGPTARIQELYEVAKTSSLSQGLLSAILPEPEEHVDTGSNIFPGWYNWRVNYWGTKWDVECDSYELVDHGDGTSTLEVEFDSAWSPPIAALEVANSQGLEVEALYHEPGMCFAGMYTSKYGDQFIDYSACNSETVRGFVGTVLDDKFGIAAMLAECEEED